MIPMSLFIQNNSGPIYSDCTITIHNGQTTVQQPEDITPSEPAESPSPYPQKNDYNALVAWLEEQKAKGIDYYAAANMNRSKMCRKLSEILGWTVDQNSLRKAQQR